ncbi:ATP-dependent helicase HrpB [Sinomonas cellulolyticus]|uniref:ATP-dependent helicase HrpB n=1 Tax=Sinomonas cellulolyticus TaxID=2801916 RepID=A0ABS1K6G8_9MICC|nr:MULTISPECIES: ATP-dependent helicase HrpB [Sinomonas]MBL0707109.1 ATP-dependent helicase HrpB [Sinomonas cellulolyticus]GHG54762.1 ATP-dependent helicase HrpB [Sinomonas sp. KCTC 49339]
MRRWASQPFDLERIGAGLPFEGSLPELAAALAAPGAAAVVQAPPGTGKTTLVPPLVANLVSAAGAGRHGTHDGAPAPRVVVTQPRRVAVRAAARRLAALDGTAIGGRVGYTVRGERHTSPGTRVEFVTPGILVRRLLADPGLEGVDAVVLDEVHERGLETDLLVGMLAEVRQLRGDLTLVAMSATLDAPRFAALLGGDEGAVPVVDCPSALFPLEVGWAPSSVPRLDERGVTRGFLDHVADVALDEHRREQARGRDVDALVFVPGAREVRHVAERLRSRARGGPDRIEVLELHGQAPAAEQDRAVSGRGPGDGPRIVVSTALAESSLTVPGVRLVVDSGLAREPRRDASRGMSGLVTVSCSRASAEQRAGRAARQGPGCVVRCYDERAFAAAPVHSTPEITTADLTEAALVLACWGAPGGVGLALPDAPPAPALAEAVGVLAAIGAVDDDGHATSLGRTLGRIPADPRLGRALLEGAGLVGPRAAAEAVALVARDLRPAGADLGRLLRALRSGRDPQARAWAEDVRRFERIAREARAGSGGGDPGWPGGDPGRQVGVVVALAFPRFVARRVPGYREQYLLASGTRAGLPVGSPLTGHEWLAIADAARAAGRDAAGTGAVVRAAAPISQETAVLAAGHLLTDRVEARFDAGRIAARRDRRLGAIQLESTPVRPAREEGHRAVVRALEAEGLGVIGWSDAADGLRRRLALVRRELGDPWPDVSAPALLARLDEWLAPEVDALAGGTSVRGVDLAEPLRRLLPWPEAARFDELAPERLEVPSGSRVRIEYPPVEDRADDGAAPAGRPVVAVKLQECFGWAETPRLVDGRVPVLFHLLSPAGRPLAVTDDLASFWSGPYAQVRAEMRGRYPKHPWPEDPWTAVATAKTKRRM